MRSAPTRWRAKASRKTSAYRLPARSASSAEVHAGALSTKSFPFDNGAPSVEANVTCRPSVVVCNSIEGASDKIEERSATRKRNRKVKSDKGRLTYYGASPGGNVPDK